MRKLAAVVALAVGLYASPGLAQQCMPLASVAEHMAQHEAQIVNMGNGARGRIMVWVDRDGDFYIVGIPKSNEDIGCLLEMGKDWSQYTPKPKNPA